MIKNKNKTIVFAYETKTNSVGIGHLEAISECFVVVVVGV